MELIIVGHAVGNRAVGVLRRACKEYIVLPQMVAHYLVQPYMVLCNVYKQYIVDLGSFV